MLELFRQEKVLAAADVFDQVVFFTTYTPESTSKCEKETGTSRLYAVRMGDAEPALDFDTGKEDSTGDRYEEVGGGIPSEPKVMVGETADVAIVATTEGEVSSVSMPPSETKELRYWREVY